MNVDRLHFEVISMQDETKLTIDYYNRNAKSFTQDTVAAGMDVVRQQFLSISR